MKDIDTGAKDWYHKHCDACGYDAYCGIDPGEGSLAGLGGCPRCYNIGYENRYLGYGRMAFTEAKERMEVLHMSGVDNIEKTIEWCSDCGYEIEIDRTGGHCPHCGRWNLPCSDCDHETCDCRHCPYERYIPKGSGITVLRVLCGNARGALSVINRLQEAGLEFWVLEYDPAVINVRTPRRKVQRMLDGGLDGVEIIEGED